MAEARVVEGVWSESATTFLARPGWHREARCAGRTDLFFSSRYEGPRPSKRVRLAMMEAKNICHGCPVINQCLEFALDGEEGHGIWGGLTTRERDMVRTRTA